MRAGVALFGVILATASVVGCDALWDGDRLPLPLVSA